MALLTFRFHTQEIEHYARGFGLFADDVPEVAIGELVRQVRELAESGVDPNGRKWPVLTTAYARKKKAMGLPPIPNKRVTGAFLASVKGRDGIVAPDAAHEKIGEGLERKRISFQPAPISVGNVERILFRRFLQI